MRQVYFAMWNLRGAARGGRAAGRRTINHTGTFVNRNVRYAIANVSLRHAPSAARKARALQVGAYLPCGQHFPPSAWRRDLAGVLPGLPQFTNVRRMA